MSSIIRSRDVSRVETKPRVHRTYKRKRAARESGDEYGVLSTADLDVATEREDTASRWPGDEASGPLPASGSLISWRTDRMHVPNAESTQRPTSRPRKGRRSIREEQSRIVRWTPLSDLNMEQAIKQRIRSQLRNLASFKNEDTWTRAFTFRDTEGATKVVIPLYHDMKEEGVVFRIFPKDDASSVDPKRKSARGERMHGFVNLDTDGVKFWQGTTANPPDDKPNLFKIRGIEVDLDFRFTLTDMTNTRRAGSVLHPCFSDVPVSKGIQAHFMANTEADWSMADEKWSGSSSDVHKKLLEADACSESKAYRNQNSDVKRRKMVLRFHQDVETELKSDLDRNGHLEADRKVPDTAEGRTPRRPPRQQRYQQGWKLAETGGSSREIEHLARIRAASDLRTTKRAWSRDKAFSFRDTKSDTTKVVFPFYGLPSTKGLVIFSGSGATSGATKNYHAYARFIHDSRSLKCSIAFEVGEVTAAPADRPDLLKVTALVVDLDSSRFTLTNESNTGVKGAANHPSFSGHGLSAAHMTRLLKTVDDWTMDDEIWSGTHPLLLDNSGSETSSDRQDFQPRKKTSTVRGKQSRRARPVGSSKTQTRKRKRYGGKKIITITSFVPRDADAFDEPENALGFASERSDGSDCTAHCASSKPPSVESAEDPIDRSPFTYSQGRDEQPHMLKASKDRPKGR